MSKLAGRNIGLIGALAAFPRRLAAREVERQGGRLRRGVNGKTDLVVFGRRLLERYDEAEIEKRISEARSLGKNLLSENGLLRLLGTIEETEVGTLSTSALSQQSGLSQDDIEKLSLFDAFVRDREPFAFRDRILAGKYAELRREGVGWKTIAQSIHRATDPQGLTSVSMQPDGHDAVYARIGDSLAELSGQFVMPVAHPDKHDQESLFSQAEAWEAEGHFEEAVRAYERYLGLDPSDAMAAFNRANCLKAGGRRGEALNAYLQTVKLDPDFAEAWFNHAGMKKEGGDIDAARRSLKRALAVDDTYTDAIYNLAALEFDAGDLPEARRHWVRYLELDDNSDWAARARRGIQFIDRQAQQQRTG